MKSQRPEIAPSQHTQSKGGRRRKFLVFPYTSEDISLVKLDKRCSRTTNISLFGLLSSANVGLLIVDEVGYKEFMLKPTFSGKEPATSMKSLFMEMVFQCSQQTGI